MRRRRYRPLRAKEGMSAPGVAQPTTLQTCLRGAACETPAARSISRQRHKDSWVTKSPGAKKETKGANPMGPAANMGTGRTRQGPWPGFPRRNSTQKPVQGSSPVEAQRRGPGIQKVEPVRGNPGSRGPLPGTSGREAPSLLTHNLGKSKRLPQALPAQPDSKRPGCRVAGLPAGLQVTTWLRRAVKPSPGPGVATSDCSLEKDMTHPIDGQSEPQKSFAMCLGSLIFKAEVW